MQCLKNKRDVIGEDISIPQGSERPQYCVDSGLSRRHQLFFLPRTVFLSLGNNYLCTIDGEANLMPIGQGLIM